MPYLWKSPARIFILAQGTILRQLITSSPIFTDTDHIPLLLIQEANFDPAADTSDDRLLAMMHQQETAQSPTNGPMYSDAELGEQLSRLHIDGNGFDLMERTVSLNYWAQRS